jgi:hypothetical protein
MAVLTRPGTKSAGAEASGSLPTRHVVNLLPPETLERQRARVLVRRFVLAALGLVVVGAAVWLAQAAAIDTAEQELVAAESDLESAQAELEPLQPVKGFAASLEQQEQLVGTSMALHTSFSRVLDGFAASWPAGSRLRTLDVALGAGCAGPDTFEPAPSIGCVTWTVTVPGETQVRELTASLGDSPGLVSPFLTGAVRDQENRGFEATGTVNFDDRLLTGRFHELLEGVAP